MGQRARDVAGGGALGPEVEVQERRVDALGDLALQELEVAARLLLGVADGAEVAEVLDAHLRVGDALGQRRQLVGELLVDAALEAVLGAVAKEPQRVVLDGRAVLELADVVGLGQEDALAPGVAQQLAQARAVALDEDLVGVEVHQPIGGRRVQADVAGRGEVAVPLVVQDGRAEGLGDRDRPVGRPGVDDDQLVDEVHHSGQAAREHRLLVLDDHAEAGGLIGRRHGLLGGALGTRAEVAQRAQHLRRQALGRGDALLAAALALAQVGRDVGEVGVQALGGAKERLGGDERAQLVEQDAGEVQQDRLARGVLERLDGGDRAGQQALGVLPTGARAVAQHRLQQ